MRVLGLDTSTRATAVAVLDTASDVTVTRRDDPPAGARPGHTRRLLALCADALGAAGIGWAGIELVAVGTGPGTFTGIRIGVASARAIAAARAVPIVGVSTLRALAAGAAPAASARGRSPLAVLDARRREVFVAGWDAAAVADPTVAPSPAPAALAPARLGEILAGERGGAGAWLAVGDGALAVRAMLEEIGVAVPPDDASEHRVSAVEICRLALDLPAGAVDEVRPDYLRLPDAELSRRAAQGVS